MNALENCVILGKCIVNGWFGSDVTRLINIHGGVECFDPIPTQANVIKRMAPTSVWHALYHINSSIRFQAKIRNGNLALRPSRPHPKSSKTSRVRWKVRMKPGMWRHNNEGLKPRQERNCSCQQIDSITLSYKTSQRSPFYISFLHHTNKQHHD